ncbi:MAG: S8 family serine peptidase [Firmicutes bacterium]|nr:S8 family serine peptidase [Bacillota bacterium]
MKNIFISICLVLVMTFTMSTFGGSNSSLLTSESIQVSNETKTLESRKIYSRATIDDDFCDSSIIVVMDEDHSFFSTSPKYENDRFFNDIRAKTITDLTALPEGAVTSRGEVSRTNAPALAEHFDTTSFRQILHIELEGKNKENVLHTVRRVERMSGVRYVGVNTIDSGLSPNSNPNDPLLSFQWALIGDAPSSQGINVRDAWAITSGSHNVRVGVIDSGIAFHNDLDANLTTGWDFYNNVATTNDIDGHGTGVAGIIGAVGGNGIGITGVAQNVTLVPLKTVYYDSNGNAWHTTADRISAIIYARNLWGTSQQISILNHSIGGFGTNVSLLDAVRQFPGLFVWSAGNDGINTDTLADINQFLPSVDVPNLISVGAVDRFGARSQWSSSSSNFGFNGVNIFAPGGWGTNTFMPSENILTTGINNDYWTMNGTSAAAPHVAGVAALMLSVNPNIPARNLRGMLMTNSDTITISTPAGSQTVRRLNAGKAVEAAQNFSGIQHMQFIYTAGELTNMRTSPNGHFVLMRNITLAGEWVPIPNFNGIFEGNNFTVSDLRITIPTTQYNTVRNFGMFERLTGSVTQLTLNNVNISTTGSQHNGEWVHVGALAAVTENAFIHNVKVTNSIISIHRQSSTAGGVVGRADTSEIYFARVENLTLTGNGYRGGVVGHLEGSHLGHSSIHSSLITIWISRNNRSTGGVVGLARANSSVSSCTINSNTIVRFTGSDNINAQNLEPPMGLIVGRLDGSQMIHVGRDNSNIVLDRGSLTTIRFGFLNSQTHNQAKYVGTGPWGSVGRSMNGSTII